MSKLTPLMLGVLSIIVIFSNSQQRKFMSNFEFVPSWVMETATETTATTTTDDVDDNGSNNKKASASAEQEEAEELLTLTATKTKYHNTIINDVYKYQPPSIDSSSSSSSSKGNENENNNNNNNNNIGCGVSPDFNVWSSIPHVTNRSRYGEDMKIYNLFFKDHNIYNNNNNNNNNMTYVELGAFDGIRESNTHFYDYCLGWNGLLLEGNPVKFKELLINRPNAHKMNFAPSCSEWNTTVTFFTSKFTNAGIKDMAKGYSSDKDKKIEHDVPCGPLGPILEKVFQSNNYKINFFSLDVEGAEKLVLDTIDFTTKVHIDILMIEVVNAFCKQNEECLVRDQVREKMVNELGYIKYENIVPASDIYVHPNSKYQMKK